MKFTKPFDSRYANYEESVSIGMLPISVTMPEMVIGSMDRGSVEEFRVALGITDAENNYHICG